VAGQAFADEYYDCMRQEGKLSRECFWGEVECKDRLVAAGRPDLVGKKCGEQVEQQAPVQRQTGAQQISPEPVPQKPVRKIATLEDKVRMKGYWSCMHSYFPEKKSQPDCAHDAWGDEYDEASVEELLDKQVEKNQRKQQRKLTQACNKIGGIHFGMTFKELFDCEEAREQRPMDIHSYKSRTKSVRMIQYYDGTYYFVNDRLESVSK